MWPLYYFESNQLGIPEIDNSPSWDGILLFILAVAFYLGFRALLYKELNVPMKRSLKCWGIFLIVFLLSVLALLLEEYGGYTNILAYFGGITLVGVSLFQIWRIFRAKSSYREKLKYIGFDFLLLIIILICLYGWWYSYVYFLPASYPPEERDQLRMIRRIIEIEPHESDLDIPFVSLNNISLNYDGKEWIPDSIRKNSEYQEYKYKLSLDTPQKKLFTLDVIPIDYKEGMKSFHAYPVNPEELNNKDFKYIVYCITMADRKGKPATDKDRHFHEKSYWYLLTRQQ